MHNENIGFLQLEIEWKIRILFFCYMYCSMRVKIRCPQLKAGNDTISATILCISSSNIVVQYHKGGKSQCLPIGLFMAWLLSLSILDFYVCAVWKSHINLLFEKLDDGI